MGRRVIRFSLIAGCANAAAAAAAAAAAIATAVVLIVGGDLRWLQVGCQGIQALARLVGHAAVGRESDRKRGW